jgi:3D (Asp-Asp-Asp) domain-containing protein
MRSIARRLVACAVGVVLLAGGALALASPWSADRRSAQRRARARIAAPRPPRPAARTPGAQAAPAAAKPCPPGPQLHEHLITRPRWLRGVAITEYYSSPERWFAGRNVPVPGLPGRHRVDWLYSSRGVAMEGDGIGLDGRHYHIDALGTGGWVNRNGHLTRPGRCASRWSRGRPAWLAGGWRNRQGEVTFPLASGGWSNGPGSRERSYQGVTFAPGSSLPLRAYRTLAVDPRLIPRGSRVYIPYYKGISGGWFVAQDTGGAIIGRHVDVYRPPTASPADGGRFLQGQKIFVVPPHR